MIRRLVASLGVCALLAPAALAQITGDKIDYYFGDWHDATPRTVRGSLEERDILTRGDAANPTQKGAVLRYMNSYTYDTLAPQASTKPTKLDGQQEIYFVESGKGTMIGGWRDRRSLPQHCRPDAGKPRVHDKEHWRPTACHVRDQRAHPPRFPPQHSSCWSGMRTSSR